MRLLQTQTFRSWFTKLDDRTVKAVIRTRLGRLSLGNPGDAGPVGEGVSELRIHLGAGWRVYYLRRGSDIILLLCGGSKRTQAKDIATAIGLASSDLEGLEE